MISNHGRDRRERNCHTKQVSQERRGEHLLYVNRAPVASVSTKMSKRDCVIAKTSLKIR